MHISYNYNSYNHNTYIRIILMRRNNTSSGFINIKGFHRIHVFNYRLDVLRISFKSYTIYIYIYINIYIYICIVYDTIYVYVSCKLYIVTRYFAVGHFCCWTVWRRDPCIQNTGYGYIRAPSAVIETALICKLKASVRYDRV